MRILGEGQVLMLRLTSQDPEEPDSAQSVPRLCCPGSLAMAYLKPELPGCWAILKGALERTHLQARGVHVVCFCLLVESVKVTRFQTPLGIAGFKDLRKLPQWPVAVVFKRIVADSPIHRC